MLYSLRNVYLVMSLRPSDPTMNFSGSFELALMKLLICSWSSYSRAWFAFSYTTNSYCC